jgi:hypothetical protein
MQRNAVKFLPLTPADIDALEIIGTQIQRDTGSKPSLGQIASVILRAHLESLKNSSSGASKAPPQPKLDEPVVSLSVVKQMIEEQLQPLRQALAELIASRSRP